jgi:hypothetical protein
VRVPILLFLVVLVALATGISAALAGLGHTDFSAHVTNPWFPLKRDSTYVYTGVKDGQPARDVVTVTDDTRLIAGVPCAVVKDRLYIRGRLHERTTDWYTQDAKGNVWYFGEATAELNDVGKITSTEGSWMAGVDEAKPGIFMPARPQVGQAFRQEFYKGHAEDHFRIVAIQRTVGPHSSEVTLLTEEWTPLEPGVLDHKLYARGVGTVIEQTVKGGNERAELISVRG